MIAVGCDPGLEYTGLAAVDTKGEGTILGAALVHTTLAKRDPADAWIHSDPGGMTDIQRRVREICEDVADYCAEAHAEVLVVELFRDQGARRKQFSDRWKTALVVGGLITMPGLPPIAWVDPLVVSGKNAAMGQMVGMWAAGIHLIPGDERLLAKPGGKGKDNKQHCRDAAAHALHYGATQKAGYR